MRLEFNYGVDQACIDFQGELLTLGLMNPACGTARESWELADGLYMRQGDFHRIVSGQHLLGIASIPVAPDTLEAQTESLYNQLLSDHPDFSLYRIWHFVPEINRVPHGGIENYRAFCKGRAIAFENHADIELHSKIPAASAVGTTGEHLSLVYLAGISHATHIENPRQTPAYKYPPKYGPKPPTFARATTVNYNGQPTLFISGTASILASESIGSNIESQLETTLNNLQIIEEQCPQHSGNKRRVRVYLRHQCDYDYVNAQLAKNYLGPNDEVFYLVAEICRKELLVEIEVTIGL